MKNRLVGLALLLCVSFAMGGTAAAQTGDNLAITGKVTRFYTCTDDPLLWGLAIVRTGGGPGVIDTLVPDSIGNLLPKGAGLRTRYDAIVFWRKAPLAGPNFSLVRARATKNAAARPRRSGRRWRATGIAATAIELDPSRPFTTPQPMDSYAWQRWVALLTNVFAKGDKRVRITGLTRKSAGGTLEGTNLTEVRIGAHHRDSGSEGFEGF